uniref:UBC core domain-containing protein n=1 Tax=Tanacetum cinerariifolium TaxID=118510 RepID=A0A699IUP0_TANCI|nr:hypothetical protein [Tanacetum cinerariifolium]
MEDVKVADHVGAGIRRLVALDNTKVQKRFECFKRFEYVLDHSDHTFSAKMNEASPQSRQWHINIKKELDQLKNGLPAESIYVMSYTGRINLMRAVIIGKNGTPYDHGLFFFDLCFPNTYPHTPPLISYHSGGLRINPNLYMFGKLRLSLPGTTGSLEEEDEMWVLGTLTVLSLLIDIRNQILNPNSLLNDGAYTRRTTIYKEHACLLYQKNTIIKSLKTMVFIMNQPPKGLLVGGIDNGGAPVQVPMLTSSTTFENDLISCMKLLALALKNIGAEVKDTDSFSRII